MKKNIEKFYIFISWIPKSVFFLKSISLYSYFCQPLLSWFWSKLFMIFNIFLFPLFSFNEHLQKKNGFRHTSHFWEMLMMITYGLGFIVIPIDASFVFGKKRAENLVIWEIASAIGNLNNHHLLRIIHSYIATSDKFLSLFHFHHTEMSFVW